jgi:NAD(P)-dependent dehydrogenase (short-subunit alcohol dehydrogenase family)
MGEPLRLNGLNALVFNGGSGIGEATARSLIKHGATVIAVDTINSRVERHFAAVKGITGLGANLVDANQMPALVQEPVDIAKVVLFLASDDAVFVSGTGIAVDGGRAGD